MKKWHGISTQNVELENEREKWFYFRNEETSIKSFGYEFSRIDNLYKIHRLEEVVFLERGISNKVDGKSVTLKAGHNSKKVYRYEVPLYINESLYYNNGNLEAYKYLELGEGFFYTNKNNYELSYTPTNVNLLVSSNYVGIISTKNDVGVFFKGKKVKCNFVVSYTQEDIRLQIMVKGFYD